MIETTYITDKKIRVIFAIHIIIFSIKGNMKKPKGHRDNV